MILETLKRLQQEKKDRHITPTHISIHELAAACNRENNEDFLKELRQLYREKKIGCCNTLNWLAFYIKENGKDNTTKRL